MAGLTRAFVAALDELSALSFPPSRAVSVLARFGLPLLLLSLPHGATFFLYQPPILPTNGGRTTPARRRPGRKAGRRPGHPAMRVQSGSCAPFAIGGSVALKLSIPRAVSSTPSRRRCSLGGAEPSMRETCLSTTTSAAPTQLVKIVYLHEFLFVTCEFQFRTGSISLIFFSSSRAILSTSACKFSLA